jgi:SAM-dependent methyltransferase
MRVDGEPSPAYALHTSLTALRERVDALARGRDDRAYLASMWRSTLANLEGPPKVLTEGLTFPYVPVTPEELHLPLSPASRVLDVGCLGGFGLFDFHARRARRGLATPSLIGLDIDADSVAVGRDLSKVWAGDGSVTFDHGSCEAMPYDSGSIDLLVARTVLPYVDLELTVGEFARVLRPGGLALIQVHAPGYYARKLWVNLCDPLAACYHARALVAGVLYRLTRRQARWRWLRETALTLDQLADLLARHALQPLWVRPHLRRPMMISRRQ